MGKPITDWEVDERGSTPSVMHSATAEYTPVEYPRTDETRGQTSHSNKGAASRTDIIGADRTSNPTGYGQSPRRDATVNYESGPYPEAVSVADDEADMEGSGTA